MVLKKYLNSALLVVAISFLLVGCSEESSKTEEPADEAVKETIVAEETKKENVVALPNVIDDIIAWDIEAFKELWGKAEGIIFEGGENYQFERIPDVTITPDEYGTISSVIINNPDMDVYGSKVGQTPAEVKKVMDEYGFELLFEGEDEMDGGWFIEYQIDGNKRAMYFSTGETDPVAGILVKMIDTSSEETESMDNYNEGNSSSASSEPAALSAYWATVEQSGSRQIPVIEIVNEGNTNAAQISVRVKVNYSNESGNASSTTVYGQLTYLGAGQVGQIKVLSGAAYSIDDVEILEVNGIAQQ